MLRPISISLSPNTELDDNKLAFKLLFKFRKYKKGKEVKLLEDKFKEYLGVKHAFAFNSGRSSLMAILNSLELQKNAEALLQAFTCNAAANPIIWNGLKPVYVDCDKDTFNIDNKDLKSKITKNSKVVMVQHTFGLPAKVAEVIETCKEHGLILLEDCAHALGAEYQGKKVGTFGKAAFFSFSRDKIISSVYGGMVVTDDDVLARKIKDYQDKVGYPSNFWTFQQLLHPIIMNWLVLPTYAIFGKYLLVLFQWLKVLSKAVHWKEKIGQMPNYFPRRMPNALAVLALNQFEKLERFNDYRRELASLYFDELKDTNYQLLDKDYITGNVFLRFPVKHKRAHDIIRKMWSKNILIGDWYTTAIAPYDTKLDKVYYEIGSCVNAEELAKETFNLPTHINISKKEAEIIIDLLKYEDK